MTLHIYDSLTRKLLPLEPLEPGKVRMYVCGITVYDYCHIGHARMVVVFDMISRWLRASGYELNYVRNITDIDDKIIKMQAIIDMIVKLIANGHAYAAANGDVYYDVSTFESYGQLSGKRVDDLRSGARIEVNEAKTDPLDFVLWKAAKPDEPQWESPWGPGRPGWHIECSAMATACLGDHFDIHGGGMDLQFPHHENEIAQSVGATGARFAQVWLHNGFVQVDDEKMSKSLGNFFTIREVLKKYRGEEIRAFILMSHYRSPVNYSDQQLDAARAALTRLYTALRGADNRGAEHRSYTGEFATRFSAAMKDDFNTPVAFAVLFDLAREINRLRDTDPAAAATHAALLRELGGIIGFLQDDPDAFLQGTGDSAGPDDAAIQAAIDARNAARARKDFAESDRIRDELKDAGITLEDGPAGTTWRR
ncbi:MAG: cysteine--tRNA ligase [Xanthomonadaceae bacterium]|nr:cysteine--tRNA ligase [Xanthomonadaceae bacterium]